MVVPAKAPVLHRSPGNAAGGFPVQNDSERKLILSRLMPHIENINESSKWEQESTDPGRNSKLGKKKPVLLSVLACT